MTQLDTSLFKELFHGSRGRVVIVSLVVLLINIIVSMAVVSPLVDTEGALKVRVEDALSKGADGEGVDGVRKAYDDIATFRDRLSSKEELTATLSKVFKAAKRQGLTIKNSTYSPGKPDAFGVSRYTVSFPVSGVYGKIKKFIHDLESMNTPLAVKELALSRSTKGNLIELDVTLSAYFL